MHPDGNKSLTSSTGSVPYVSPPPIIICSPPRFLQETIKRKTNDENRPHSECRPLQTCNQLAVRRFLQASFSVLSTPAGMIFPFPFIFRRQAALRNTGSLDLFFTCFVCARDVLALAHARTSSPLYAASSTAVPYEPNRRSQLAGEDIYSVCTSKGAHFAPLLRYFTRYLYFQRGMAPQLPPRKTISRPECLPPPRSPLFLLPVRLLPVCTHCLPSNAAYPSSSSELSWSESKSVMVPPLPLSLSSLSLCPLRPSSPSKCLWVVGRREDRNPDGPCVREDRCSPSGLL